MQAFQLADESGSKRLLAECLIDLHDLLYVTGTGHEPNDGMPGKDGDELIRHVRRVKGDASIIIMSGYGDEFVRARRGNEPVAAVLRKPFTIDELKRAISSALAWVAQRARIAA